MMYLTNPCVSCMSVWGGFGHGTAHLVSIAGVGEKYWKSDEE